MLRHLVLDIGNVICEWNPEALIASAFDDPDERARAMRATIGDPDWLQLDRGTLALDEAVRRAVARSGLDPARIAAVYANLPTSLVAIEDTHVAIREAAAAGVPIYILSNMSTAAWAHLQTSFDVFGLCRGIAVSCEAGAIKPERAIYEALTTRHGLEPASCVFVDDLAVNVEAAIAAGWQAERLDEPERGGALVRSLAARILESGTDLGP